MITPFNPERPDEIGEQIPLSASTVKYLVLFVTVANQGVSSRSTLREKVAESKIRLQIQAGFPTYFQVALDWSDNHRPIGSVYIFMAGPCLASPQRSGLVEGSRNFFRLINKQLEIF